MKLTAAVCALTLWLAVPVASQCAAAAVPQQGPNRVAELTVEGKKGNYGSCDSLGLMYEEGDGVAKDGKRAEELYRRACDGGHANGCTNLGVLYQNGNGVAKDAARAAKLYQRACDGGSFMGCSNLGAVYGNGDGLAKDKKVTIKVYQRACGGGE